MSLSTTCTSIVNHVVNTRNVMVSDKQKREVVAELEQVITDGDYSFVIDVVGVSYSDGKDNRYPRLYGDAILHQAITKIEKYRIKQLQS